MIVPFGCKTGHTGKNALIQVVGWRCAQKLAGSHSHALSAWSASLSYVRGPTANPSQHHRRSAKCDKRLPPRSKSTAQHTVAIALLRRKYHSTAVDEQTAPPLHDHHVACYVVLQCQAEGMCQQLSAQRLLPPACLWLWICSKRSDR